MENMLKKITAGLLMAACLCVPAWAKGPAELIPGGVTVGIRLETEGLLVSSLSQVETKNGDVHPAKAAGVKPGDLLVRVGETPIRTMEDFQRAMAALNGGQTTVELLRGGQCLQLEVTPARDREGVLRLGVWLKSGISGIGTVTFQDPESGAFGLLGHGVSDPATGVRLPLRQGCITETEITGIVKGKVGEPGQLQGALEEDVRLGALYRNSDSGLFGRTEKSLCPENDCLPVGEAKVGPAEILSDLNGDLKSYAIQIRRVYSGEPQRSMLLEVTDSALLRTTGGIVQGMSGSPIIQNGKLVGAVTHVLINEPAKGYGISIGNMLDAAA